MPALGWKPDTEDRRDYPARMQMPLAVTALPPGFSWRAVMTNVRDQGNLGSCVGFACAALKEFQEYKQRTNTPFRNVSEMWIYWNAKKTDAWPNEEGTSIRDMLKVLFGTGMPIEKVRSYADTKAPRNQAPTQPAFWSKIVARWGKIGGYYRLDNLPTIKEWLFLYGPVVIGVPVGESIFNPVERAGAEGKSFVLLPSSFIGGHAITLTGYDDRYQLLQFKNSWSEGWGNRGYGYLHYNYLNNVSYDAWAIKDA